MATEYGFVYFLKNDATPGVYKVGFTTKHPLTRMAELSKATACSVPFDMLGYFDHATPHKIEQIIHKMLHQYRVNPEREFFQAPLQDLQDIARQFGDPSGIWNFATLDKACFDLYGCDQPESTVGVYRGAC